MRSFGPKFVANFQEFGGGRMFYHTHIRYENLVMKYGVISREALIVDLLDWDRLYVAGRLHKPVKIFGKAAAHEDIELHSALRINLSNALHTALLTLPERFSELTLYERIAGLSYTGDIRMITGLEDVRKVRNIVTPSVGLFRSLYRKRMQKLEHLLEFKPGHDMIQDLSPSTRLFHLTMLPRNLQDAVVTVWNDDHYWRDKEDILMAYAKETDNQDLLLLCLRHIVSAPTIVQTAKGVVSIGIAKSLLYSLAKLKKSLASRV